MGNTLECDMEQHREYTIKIHSKGEGMMDVTNEEKSNVEPITQWLKNKRLGTRPDSLVAGSSMKNEDGLCSYIGAIQVDGKNIQFVSWDPQGCTTGQQSIVRMFEDDKLFEKNQTGNNKFPLGYNPPPAVSGRDPQLGEKNTYIKKNALLIIDPQNEAYAL